MTLVAGFAAVPASAQVRASQPGVLEIAREVLKPGRGGAHAAVERDWAAFGRQHGAPGYIALTSNSGASEAWYLFGHSSWAAYDSSQAYAGKDPTYAAGNSRLAEMDGEHLTGSGTILATAVPEAGHGAFPDLSQARVYEITTFRMKMGMDAAFTQLAKGYAAIARTNPAIAGWRVYSVAGGMPSGTFLAITTFPSYAAREANEKLMGAAIAATPKATMDALTKLGNDAMMSMETRFFNVSPGMSLAPAEWLTQPFWKP
jgi:hypothetical protein